MAGLDITPRVAAGKKVIQAYGNGCFRIAGERVRGSQIVFPDRNAAWDVRSAEDVTVASLEPVLVGAEAVRILLIGCGRRFTPPPRVVTEGLRRHGVVVDWMDTGAACRTFNVLLSEDREVAAALVAVD